MTTSVREILRSGRLETHFLPVLDVQLRCIHAWEALARGPEGAFPDSSFPLLHAAQEENLQSEFELTAIRHAVDRFRFHDPGVKLWLNSGSDLLLDETFVNEVRELLNETRANPTETQMIMRLPRDLSPAQMTLLSSALKSLQPFEVIVAFDQLPDSREFAEVCRRLPALHYLKIGRHAIRDLPSRAIKRMHLDDLASKAREFDIQLIAEGVETMEELHAIRPLRPQYVQGFLFGRPGDPPEVDVRLLPELEVSAPVVRKRDHWKSIGDLMTPAPVVTRRTPLSTIKELLANHPELPGIPVLDEARPAGLIHRCDVESREDDAIARDLLDASITIAGAHEEPADVLRHLVEDSHGQSRLPEILFVQWDGLYQGVVLLESLRSHLQN
ncbi:EAL domain-containing protein [bacterium]|nr:EAL domain-containing protein [bacterium]